MSHEVKVKCKLGCNQLKTSLGLEDLLSNFLLMWLLSDISSLLAVDDASVPKHVDLSIGLVSSQPGSWLLPE